MPVKRLLVVLMIVLTLTITLSACVTETSPTGLPPDQESTTDLTLDQESPTDTTVPSPVPQTEAPEAIESAITALPGTWQLTGDFLQPGKPAQLNLLITAVEPDPQDESLYLATGCMQTGESQGWAPLSMQAIHKREENRYEMTILSTLIPLAPVEQTPIIRLIGIAEKSATASSIHAASGTSYSSLGEVAWQGEHLTQGVSECPTEYAEVLVFRGLLDNHRDSAYSPPLDFTYFNSIETNIVAARMQVEAPDGQVYLVEHYTDIFTPSVDFIENFRFAASIDGLPIPSEPYTFTLLDILGRPIAGAESQDVYLSCDHQAVTDLSASFLKDAYLELQWQAPPLIPGRFDPQNGNGFYQITLEPYPWKPQGQSYGAEASFTTHQVPWLPFTPGSPGMPEGTNFGVSLSELDDGEYAFMVGAYDNFEPVSGSDGWDCRVEDSRQRLIITKAGDNLSVRPVGAISGMVYDQDGLALPGIAVEIEGLDSGFYEKVCSDQNGFYLFMTLPLDTFILRAGGFAGEGCSENSFATQSLDEVILTGTVPIIEEANFTLPLQP